MATVQESLHVGPEDAGRLMTPEDFDAAEAEEGWRYELIRGVLVVSPIPRKPSRGMAGKLIYHLFTGSVLRTSREETRPCRCGC
jgi:hypothetical protein